MPIQEKARILEHQQIAPEHYKLTLSSPTLSSQAQAGQFVQVKVSSDYDPLLRRPLSFHRIDKERKFIELLYRVVGRGTEMLSQARVGDNLDLLGPLGKGFSIDPSKQVAIVLGGGYGTAPLLALAEALKHKIKAVYLLLGAQKKDLVLCEKEFRDLGVELLISTDDGSYGHKGTVIDLIPEVIPSKLSPFLAQVFACGPHPMLEQVAEICAELKVSCQVSLEEKMACGFGVCLGCALKTKSGYKMVCKDGPVFDAQEIIWKT
jgi:dihydroorotate dehydrogenase electron transfer subunit